MKNIIKGIGLFAAGALIGSYITKKCMEKIYDKVLEKMENGSENLPGEEIPENNLDSKIEIAQQKLDEEEFNDFYKKSQMDYINRIKEEGYVFNEHTTVISESGEVMYDEDRPDPPTERYDENGEELEEYPVLADRPYNIPPEEFEVYVDCESDWDSLEYTYFKDGFVTDEQGMPVDPADVERCLGTEFPKWFGTYDDSQIWVRNDRLKMDFSVVKDLQNFADVADPRLRKLAGI